MRRPLWLIAIVTTACSSSAPTGSAPLPRPVASVDAGVAVTPADAAPLVVVVPDATAITSLDVFQSAARNATTFYWRVPTDPPTCQAWRTEPDDEYGATGRILRDGGPAIGFRYEVDIDLVRIYGSYLADGRPSESHCEDVLHPRSDDATAIAFDGGAWFWDAASCERATEAMPPGCAAAVAAATAVTTKAGDPLAKVIKKRRSVYLLQQRKVGYACVKYTFGKTNLETRDADGASGWEVEYEPGKLTLSGDYAETTDGSGMALGTFAEYAVQPLTASIVLVGGFPWFLDEASCARALVATGS